LCCTSPPELCGGALCFCTGVVTAGAERSLFDGTEFDVDTEPGTGTEVTVLEDDVAAGLVVVLEEAEGRERVLARSAGGTVMVRSAGTTGIARSAAEPPRASADGL
jgi:hypothetical protein